MEDVKVLCFTHSIEHRSYFIIGEGENYDVFPPEDFVVFLARPHEENYVIRYIDTDLIESIHPEVQMEAVERDFDLLTTMNYSLVSQNPERFAVYRRNKFLGYWNEGEEFGG